MRESRREVGEAGEMCESMERSGRGWEMAGRMGEKWEGEERWERSGRGWRDVEESW